jgi:integrase/recombinase XerC
MPVTHEVAGSSPVRPATLLESKKQQLQVIPPNLGANFLCDISPTSEPLTGATSSKVRHFGSGFLSVAEAAAELGKSASTITRWCESGKLPAIPKTYGLKVTYAIAPASLEVLKTQQRKEAKSQKASQKQQKPHFELMKPWLNSLSKGILTGRAFSPHTVSDYKRQATTYFQRSTSVSVEGIKAGLARIPAKQISKRQHFYKALVCFGRFLVREGQLEPEFLEEVKPLSPKRHLPPKRLTVSEEGLKSLLEAATSPMEKALIQTLASTGLRASELCHLQIGDIDFETRILTVRIGKGGKSRKVGLGSSCLEALSAYLKTHPSPETAKAPVFLDTKGKQLDRSGLYQRLERIGKAAGIAVSPHALRRAFVTINAGKGRPLQMLQRACGHSDIKVTMAYCQTAENEVIEAMKAWD